MVPHPPRQLGGRFHHDRTELRDPFAGETDRGRSDAKGGDNRAISRIDRCGAAADAEVEFLVVEAETAFAGQAGLALDLGQRVLRMRGALGRPALAVEFLQPRSVDEGEEGFAGGRAMELSQRAGARRSAERGARDGTPGLARLS